MQPVVVYDTNILFSSILWSSKPNYCIELARQNKVKGLTCQEIIEEEVHDNRKNRLIMGGIAKTAQISLNSHRTAFC